MIYREVSVPEALRRTIVCAWEFRLEEGDPPSLEHSVPPDGTTNLLLTRGPDGAQYPRLVGPSLVAQRVQVGQGWHHVGLRLRPEAAAAVIGEVPIVGASEPLSFEGELAGVLGDLADLSSAGTDWSRTTLRLQSLGDLDAKIAAAVDLLAASGGLLPIRQVAAQLSLSERQLRRRFRASTGISPKQYAAVLRMRRALILSLTEPSWASIAHDAGFADQPHLARDIKRRFGSSASRIAGYLGGIRHEFVTPAGGHFVQYAGGDIT